ncbi:Protein FAR-RED IMPAIRED RESPONSE 1 [Bienertia sinuspersici]
MSNATNPRPNLKTDCKALLHVKRNSVGKWYVHEFLEEHNHELLPHLSKYFPCHRNLSLAVKRNVDTLNSVGSTLRTSSPFVLQASKFYTHEMFKKFQFEIFGASGCYPIRQGGDEIVMTFKVWDYKMQEDFLSLSSSALLFRGDGDPISLFIGEVVKIAITSKRKRALQQHVHSKEERYNDMCLLTAKINTETSFCDESYDLAYSMLEEVLQKCVSINNNEKEG